jgi:signal transduction histidine kinase
MMDPDAARADPTMHGSVEDHLALAPVAIAVTGGPKHELLYANGVFHHLLAAGDIALGHNGEGARRAADLTPLLDRAFERTEPVFDEIIEPSGDGTASWSCTVWPVPGGREGFEELVIEVRDVRLAEGAKAEQRHITERLLLGALHDQDAAHDAEDVSRRALHLAEVSRALSLSLDEATTRDTIRRLTLPRRGTWCIVDVVEPNGTIHRLPPIHPDPWKQALAQRLADPSVVPGRPTLSPRSVLASARPMLVTPESESALAVVAGGDENLSTLRQIGFGALLVVPLVVRARVEGGITFVSPEGENSFSAEETALATDIAARCALALENARLYREAETLRVAADLANQSKSRFLGSMSHELRTPLNAISGFVELIEMGLCGPVTEQQHDALRRIKANQQLLLTLITEILNFARIESGRIEYHRSEVPVFHALTDVAEMLSGAISERGLTREGPVGNPDAMAWADPDRVRQILVNLLMNAVKYTPSGGKITLECSADKDHVLASVSDTGPGIPSAKLEGIFEPFKQLTEGLANHQGGVGLGLTISRDLAHAMGGDLTVESTVGVGSRFTLILPTREAARRAAKGQGNSKPAAAAKRPDRALRSG